MDRRKLVTRTILCTMAKRTMEQVDTRWAWRTRIRRRGRSRSRRRTLSSHVGRRRRSGTTALLRLGIHSSTSDSYCVGAAFSTNGIEGPWVRAYAPGTADGNGYIIASTSAADKALDNTWPNCNTKGFDGFYVATWMQGPQTNGEIWLYAEAPVGDLDQGPIALWTAPAGSPTGPFTFKQYVIEPSGPDAWDGGGFSESRITYRDGLFWCFYAGATGKCKNTPPDGSNASTFKSLKPRRGRGRYVQKKCEIAAAAHGANASSAFDGEQGFCITMREAAEERAAKEAMVPTPNSDECEQFGFGVSTDGLSFTVSKFNPVGSYLNATECSKAMAEANAMYDEVRYRASSFPSRP